MLKSAAKYRALHGATFWSDRHGGTFWSDRMLES